MTLPRKTPLRRDWSAAQSKRGPCRVCGNPNVELAHLAGRRFDLDPAIGYEEIPLVRSALFVAPSRVAALCREHHRMYDGLGLEVLPYLTRDEQIQVVADLGLAAAYRRTTKEGA